MELTENIQSRKRGVDLNTNWDICFICQNVSKDPTWQGGLEKTQNALRERKKCQDYAKWDIVERLETANFLSFSDDTKLVYHKDFHKFHASEETTKKYDSKTSST